ncbi:MAG: dTDP-4-dehydrorhamnose 3,5-epimerase [Flammeovirgaceae bacterium]|jgi:dTDP-4-dehydrorhamnose 3,5-epimerase
MKVIKTGFEGLYLIEPKIFGDKRGSFYESYNKENLTPYLPEATEFVQDNCSTSNKYALRGLHFQNNPHGQIKLVRVVQGEVLDVVVDVRKNSPTYKKHFKIKLSSTNKKQLLIPVGFAHGFVTLTETAEFFYKCSDFYHPESEGGLYFNDAELGIDWEIPLEKAVLSEKDRLLENSNIKDLEFYV